MKLKMLYHIAEMKDVFFMVRRQNYLPEKTTAILKKAKNPEFWGQTSTAYHPQSWPQSSQLQL